MNRPIPDLLPGMLAPYRDDVVEIALRLRDRVLESMPNAHETVWDATNAVSLVYSPTERWQDGICHVAVYTRHVNLGFNEGAGLPDPEHVLSGTGAHIRHATFHSVDDTGVPWVPVYLAVAMAAAGMTPSDGDGGTTLRESSGRKRRPV